MKTWITADYHLGETRMEILGRPFKDQKHHIEELIRLHNSVVNPEDRVIMVGDVVYQKTPEFLPEIARFNGKKMLIRGNHDRVIPDNDFGQYFEAVYPDGSGTKMNCGGIQCFLVHYPTSGLPDVFNLVGHIHAAWKYQLNMFNIGVDANHFLPVDVDTIPFHYKAICEFYDEDVWVAYNKVNEKYKGIRGKKGRYFTAANSSIQPNFDSIIESLRMQLPEQLEEKWKFAVGQDPNGSWTAYIMGEGAEQCLACKRGIKTRQEALNTFALLNPKRIGTIG